MMTGRARILLRGGLLLVLLAFLFVQLDFKAASSSTSTQSNVAKYTMGIAKGAAGQMPETMAVAVEGNGSLAESMRWELAKKLGPGTQASAGEPLAIVSVRDEDVRWTPVYARTALVVSVAYASDGDMSWRDAFTVRMGRPDGGPQVRVRGDIDLADVTTGVISEPAYRRHLAEQIAAVVDGTLKQQLAK